VVGEAGDGEEAVALARDLKPDVVLMDVRMPKLDGIAATRLLIQDDKPPRVLVLTTFDLDEYVYGALRAGAIGFLLTDAPEEQLTAAIRIAADGGALFSPGVTPATDRTIRIDRRRCPATHAERTQRTRNRGGPPHRARELERRDRRRTRSQRAHGQDTRRPDPAEVGAA
jgi:DNA-binding NarL/FixJ family response regulator